LLGYSLFSEPQSSADTVVNFLGIEGKPPNIYYSSHNGTDFGLYYGTPVLASESGQASYHYCQSCGHTIKIDHQNGYQTIYMHLQRNGLVTTAAPVQVNKGNILGYVGMTGRTSGPHLHFQVTKDTNGNNDLDDDSPDGYTDPFGWQSNDFMDPWPLFSWGDSSGNHSGTKSKYLWTVPVAETRETIKNPGDLVQLENKKIEFTAYSLAKPLTINLLNYPQPDLMHGQTHLKYLANTSFLVTANDLLGDPVKAFTDPVTLVVDINGLSTENILIETLKIYFWNEVNFSWEPLPTFLDLAQNVVSAETTHFSHFAVLGEKIDANPPLTEVLITGQNDNGWFVEHPTLEFVASDVDGSSIDKTFYTLNNEETWEIYSGPFVMVQEGVTDVLFRSQDVAGNLEKTGNTVIKVDTQNRWIDGAVVRNAIFQFK
jgi:hypothetical protein